MNPKRILMIAFIAAAIAAGGGTMADTAGASPLVDTNALKIKATSLASRSIALSRKDSLLEALGVSSNDEIYDALYNGKSLADIAIERKKDVQSVIDLQIAEMKEQLRYRLTAGSLTPMKYQAQLAELKDIITKSVHGQMNK
jgi:hypothetical protein